MPANLEKTCAVTNNSGKDIFIILPFRKGETANASVTSSPDGKFELLTSQVIPNGGSGTVSLDRYYATETGEKNYIQDYYLVAVENIWLYPVAVMHVSQEPTNATPAYPPQTITPENKKVIDQAAAFHQTLMLFPGSELAKNYFNALRQATQDAKKKADGTAGSSAAVEKAITGNLAMFFKSTENYQLVSLPALVAINDYYQGFPCMWARCQALVTYAIYSSDEKQTGFSGTLVLEKKAALDFTKPNGGYACTFYPALAAAQNSKRAVDTTRPTALIYSGGLFTIDAKQAGSKIVITASFMPKRLFNDNAKESGILIILTGNINGIPCVGFDLAQSEVKALNAAVSSKSFLDYWDAITHPKNKKQLIASILTMVSALMLIPAFALAIFNLLKAIQMKIRIKQAAKDEDVDDDTMPAIFPRQNALSDLNNTYSKLFVSNESSIPKMSFDELGPTEAFMESAQHAMALIGAMESYSSGVEELMKYAQAFDNATVLSIQSLLNNLDISIRNLGNTLNENKKDLTEALKKELSNYDTYARRFDLIYAKCNSKLGMRAKTAVNESIELSVRIVEQLRSEMNREDEEPREFDPESEEHFDPLIID